MTIFLKSLKNFWCLQISNLASIPSDIEFLQVNRNKDRCGKVIHEEDARRVPRASERSKLRRRFARAFKYAEGPRVRDEMVCKEAAGLAVQTT